MFIWYYTRGVLGVFYGNGTPWRSSFFGASPGGLYSLDFGTTAGVLEMCGLRYPHAPICILFLCVIKA